MNRRFSHEKNVYSEQSFYYLSIGGTGKRVLTPPVVLVPNTMISSFSDRYFYELDTVNLLSSGRQWFGEDFADGPGKVKTRSYRVPVPSAVTGPGLLNISCLARSFGTGSRFNVSVNNEVVLAMDIPRWRRGLMINLPVALSCQELLGLHRMSWLYGLISRLEVPMGRGGLTGLRCF